MTKIVAVHSFRGGTGKSNVTANVAAQLALRGLRVGAIDTDIQSPGIHVLFGFVDGQMPPATLNDFLAGTARITDVAVDVTDRIGSDVSGKLFLVASSISPADISAVLRSGYDVELLNDALMSIGDDLDLDLLLIDTHPGLNEETLLTTAICDTLVVLLRPDQQDYQGTAVTVDVAGRLGVPERLMVVNKVYEKLPPEAVRATVETGYGLPVVATLPLSEEVAANASAHLFSLLRPEHAWSRGICAIAARLAGP